MQAGEKLAIKSVTSAVSGKQTMPGIFSTSRKKAKSLIGIMNQKLSGLKTSKEALNPIFLILGSCFQMALITGLR